MAEIVDSQWIDRQQPIDYDRLRPQLRTGDLMFASGNHWMSRIIRRGTGSPWSHVGLVVRVPHLDRVLLLEAVEDMGVRFAPLRKYLYDYGNGKPYDGRIVLARHHWVDERSASSLVNHGVDELTRPYDLSEAFKIVLRAWFGWTRHEGNRAYICSELVEYCFARAGYQFTWSMKNYITPAEVWADPYVECLARVRTPLIESRVADAVPAPVSSKAAA